MTTGRATGPRRLLAGALLTLAVMLNICAWRPDAQLHQKPEGLSDLTESLLVGIACIETLPSPPPGLRTSTALHAPCRRL